MSSPLGPALANLFSGYHENIWLQNRESSKVIKYKLFVDDIFCLFEFENEAEDFFEFINKQHNNLKFTMEK